MEIQQTLNSDIVMIFDECTPYPATHEEAQKSLQLSLRWANAVKPITMMNYKIATRCLELFKVVCMKIYVMNL